ncbi:MAG: hypothetical protein IH984_11870 [Planctomycetes bacterium]|nr:hypothetical protein [Planctomycetota bacterium]
MNSFANDLRTWLNELPDTPKTARTMRTTSDIPTCARCARDYVRIGNFNPQEQKLLAGCSKHVQEVAQMGCVIFNAEVVAVRDGG